MYFNEGMYRISLIVSDLERKQINKIEKRMRHREGPIIPNFQIELPNYTHWTDQSRGMARKLFII